MKKLIFLIPLIVIFSLALGLLSPKQKTLALSASSFQAGNIISDSVFTNANAMSANDVQTFLSAQMPACDTNGAKTISSGSMTRAQWAAQNGKPQPPYVCLRDYVENPSNGQNNLQNPGASIPGGMSAAQIIVASAQQYHINPQVLVVMLQKEQGLVTDDWPWPIEYQEAMGYNCPDSSGCSGYAGFYNQVSNAASQLRYYLDHPNAFNYWVGNYKVPYSPSCSGPTINIQNAATAALYIYTPYQPDSNVLANTNSTGSASGPGPGVQNDSCAAYGNRNFWWYFNTWFGSSTGDLVRTLYDNTVYLLSGTTAYAIHDNNVLNDFAALGPVRYTTAGEINAYSSGPALGHVVGAAGGTLYFVNASIKLPFSDCGSVANFGYTCGQVVTLTDGQLSKLANGPPATPIFRSVSNGTFYYMDSGSKRPIVSWGDFLSFHVSIVNTFTDALVNQMPTAGVPAYGSGALVKTANSGTVYLVKDIHNLIPISNFIYPQEWGLASGVRTIASSYTVLNGIENKLLCGSTYYVGTNSQAFSVTVPMMGNYGFDQSQFADGGLLCSNLPISSQALDQFIRVNSGTIYYVTGGQKQPISSYGVYLAHGGNSNNTVQVSDFFAGRLTTGSTLTQ